MSSVHHLPADLLSAYLDRELTDQERRRTEGHLDDCTACRERLEGLRRVAVGLRSLDRVAPPAVLEHGLQRHLALDAKERGLRGRLEERSLAPRRLPTHFGLVFATVIALAAILYLFTQEIGRQPNGPNQARTPGSERPAVAFEREGPFWRQEGLVGDPVRTLDAGSEEGLMLLREVPALLALVEGSGGVLLEVDGEVVLLRSEGVIDPATPSDSGEPSTGPRADAPESR